MTAAGIPVVIYLDAATLKQLELIAARRRTRVRDLVVLHLRASLAAIRPAHRVPNGRTVVDDTRAVIIREMTYSGATLVEIAEAIDVHPNTVSNWRRKLGIQRERS